jgi:hypothetical protein
VTRTEHVWRHGDREWKATSDGLWARPAGREAWTFEAWFTPVVDEILRLSKALENAGKAPLSLVPSVEAVKEPDPDAWHGTVHVGLPPVDHGLDDGKAGGVNSPRCERCGSDTSWADEACTACGEAL